MTPRPEPLSDLTALKHALLAAGLPTADLDTGDVIAADAVATKTNAADRRFWKFVDAKGQTVGYAGLEIHDREGLIRSVVVLPDLRHRGLGRAIVTSTVGEATRLGLQNLWLLTTTAADFFATLGFQHVGRDAAPPLIAATPEFRSLCPASAACMRLMLKGADQRDE